MGFGLVEGLEEDVDIPLVRLLGGRESALVDPVVDLVILPAVCLLDLRLELLRVEVNAAVFLVD